MEVVSLSNTPSYRRMILQHGKGLDKEGYYVYDQNGEVKIVTFTDTDRSYFKLFLLMSERIHTARLS